MAKRKHKRSGRLGSSPEEHRAFVGELVDGIHDMVERAEDDLREGKCLRVGTRIDEAYVLLGRARSEAVAAAVEEQTGRKDPDLLRVDAARHLIRRVDKPFEQLCVRDHPVVRPASFAGLAAPIVTRINPAPITEQRSPLLSSRGGGRPSDNVRTFIERAHAAQRERLTELEAEAHPMEAIDVIRLSRTRQPAVGLKLKKRSDLKGFHGEVVSGRSPRDIALDAAVTYDDLVRASYKHARYLARAGNFKAEAAEIALAKRYEKMRDEAFKRAHLLELEAGFEAARKR